MGEGGWEFGLGMRRAGAILGPRWDGDGMADLNGLQEKLRCALFF